MKIINTEDELNALVVSDVLAVDDDLKIPFDVDINIDIRCKNLIARNISAYGISANNISANNINARDISYYAVCSAYKDIICKKITGKRKNARHFCLDGRIIIKGDKND